MPTQCLSPHDLPQAPSLNGANPQHPEVAYAGSSTSLRELWLVIRRRRRLFLSLWAGLLLLCMAYCLLAPNQYEAAAKVALRTAPASTLGMEASGPYTAVSILSAPLQQETLATFLRSDQLAWNVILHLKLYQAAAFNGRFENLFPVFQPDTPSPEAQDYLLKRFQRCLWVQSQARSLVVEVRFRTRDASLSAAIVNDLIRLYQAQETRSHVQATATQSVDLTLELQELKARVDQDQQHLADFQTSHGLLSTPDLLGNGDPGESEHNSTLLEVDELGRQLVTATTDRILREVQFRSASHGDPELVAASDPRLQSEEGNFATAILQQIHVRHSELELEAAQLGVEHGPSFPRVLEIRRQLEDLDAQKKLEDARLLDRFHSALQTATDRERMLKASLKETTAEGMKLNQGAVQYAALRQEANANHDLYMRLQSKVEEARLAAAVQGSAISVIDLARQPVKPISPDLWLYLAITFFAGFWLALAGTLLTHSFRIPTPSPAAALLTVLLAPGLAGAQAPTPNLDGLPTGVARLPFTDNARTSPTPNPKDAPTVWSGQPATTRSGGLPPPASESPLPAPIGSGDFLDVAESHTPEFHSGVRVASDGTIMLPMVGQVQIAGLDEQSAARAIQSALLTKGMLLHPQVTVLVTQYAGQDVSVLGEVSRPGVYPYTLHHRLLDVISSASGLSANAGRLVNVFHRDDPRTPHPVVLDPGGTDTVTDHNPELNPGDTVQVSRAGLVYVIGDVVRPGGFAVDPAQGLTVVQALSLAWGPTPNAGSTKALLIREQKGGRTLTTLNLRRMIRGQDPDQPIRDRDILFIPDSMAKNMWNRTMEAAIQSAIGVTIYAGLVYSQRF